mgnify:CR=1 FL=1
MGYIISDDTKELLKDVKEFCDNEIKEQVKEYDIKGEWPKPIYDMATEMQLTMMDVPEEYGGDTIMVPVSAKKQIGIDDLLENVLLRIPTGGR